MKGYAASARPCAKQEAHAPERPCRWHCSAVNRHCREKRMRPRSNLLFRRLSVSDRWKRTALGELDHSFEPFSKRLSCAGPAALREAFRFGFCTVSADTAEA